MTTSKTDFDVNGLEISVYGLTEYKELTPSTPVAVMFAMHGRLQDKTKMEAIAQVLCSLNGHKGGKQKLRHLLVITFDHENHGTRLESKKRNFSWKKNGKHHNPNHAMDQWHMMQAAAQTVTGLMDVLESHLFGPGQNPVQVWGVLGFSMGAHSSYLVASTDPRISVHISVVGTGDFIGLLRARLNQGGFPPDYLPDSFCDSVLTAYEGLAQKLMDKKILMINGGDDTMVPAKFNDGLVKAFEDASGLVQGRDWARVVVPGLGHAWCPETFYLSSVWCRQWMLVLPDPHFTLPSISTGSILV